MTTILTLATWFAIVTGFVEAAGLELFQKINWANWGHTTHVSSRIFWLAPLWDVVLFVPLAVTLFVVSRALPRLPATKIVVFALSLLMFYDWLALPERLIHRSAVILAVGLATVMVRAFGKYGDRVLKVAAASLPWLAAVALLACVGIEGGGRLREEIALKQLPAAASGAPNVAVIVVDTLRADHLSAQGYTRVTSPNIDRVAQQGVLFENAISASSWTLPSHASLLSGRYAYEHGATDVKLGATALDDRYPTLPEVLARNGYRTGAFSGNYLYFSGNLGFKRGFIRFEDYFHSTFDGFTRTLYGREIGRLVFKREKIRRLIIRLGFPSIDELQPLGDSSWMLRKRASEVNREALNWIDRDPQRPFFVFMNYFDVHRPYTTPPGWPPRQFVHLNTHELMLEEVDSPTPEGRTNAYDECIAYEDHQLQDFLDQLKQRGLSEKTLLVITSDHGDMLGEHGLYAHRNSLYRPLIHVPLIFWAPGRVPSGVRISTPVSNISIAATITAELGIGQPFPGHSLSSLWTSLPSSQPWPHPLSELARFKDESRNNPSRYGAMNSLVTPQYHYMSHDKFGTELFDWVHDADEKTTLTRTPDGNKSSMALAEELHDRLAHPQ